MRSLLTYAVSRLAQGSALLRRLAGPRQRIKLLLICGPWGSGTTAVAGMVARLGTDTIEPYYTTSDPRTRNSYESLPFLKIVQRYASERTLKRKVPSERIVAALSDFHDRIARGEFGRRERRNPAPIFLKCPVSALLLPEICAVFDTQLVYVNRPLEDIEKTRMRRMWSEQYGRAGAELIYRVMDSFKQWFPKPILLVEYEDLLAFPDQGALAIARFAGLNPSPAALLDATNFVRPDRGEN